MVATLLVAVVGLTSLFVVILLMQVMRKIEGIGASSLIDFIPTLAFGYQTHLIPIASLVAAVLAYGRLHAERETTALYAGGVAPWKLLLPVVLLGILMCVPAGYANFVGGPKAYRERDTLKRQALADVLSSPPTGQHTLSFPNIKISYQDYRDDAFEGVVVLTTGEDDRVDNMLTCTRASLRFSETTSILTLIGASDATLLHFGEEGRVHGPSVRLHIRSLSEKLPIGTKTGRISPKADSLSDQLYYIEEDFENPTITEYHSASEFVKRVMFSLAPLVFSLLGALIALWLPTRNRLVAMAVALAIAGGLFYTSTVIAASMVVNGIFLGLGSVAAIVIPPLMCCVVVAAVAVAFTWRLHRV